MKDRELWEQARAGDRNAIDALLRRHEKSIYRFGLRMCGDEDAAREVLQRTLLTAFERLGEFRGDAEISTWLYAIARSACSRLHRRTRSAPLHDVELDADDALELPIGDDVQPSPERSTEAAEVAAVVASAIDLLPPAYREVVVLRDVEGLTAEEAAKVLELEIPALKSRLHRAREQLRSNLVTLLREQRGEVGSARACPELRRQLAQSSDVDQAACKAIEAHLATCAACAESLGDLRDAASLCRRLPTGEVPLPVQRAVRLAITTAIGGLEPR